MINYLKLVRFEMLCITLTPVVECIHNNCYYDNYFLLSV